MPLEEDLKILEGKLTQLKLGYEQFFLGSRRREPTLLRGEVQKTIARLTNEPMQNTALRFKFGSLCARYQAMKRHWDDTLRQIEEGRYTRHRFKASLRERERSDPVPRADAPGDAPELYAAYVDARRACGQEVRGLTPEKLESVISRQRKALGARFGSTRFRFKVVVEDGKAKLKASPVKG